jgi:hypothetical protein
MGFSRETSGPANQQPATTNYKNSLKTKYNVAVKKKKKKSRGQAHSEAVTKLGRRPRKKLSMR